MKIRTIAELSAMTEITGIGDKRAVDLYEAFDSFEELLDAPSSAFDDFHYVDQDTTKALDEIEATVTEREAKLTAVSSEDIDLVGIFDDDYPNSLRDAHAPILLYARGDTQLLTKQAVTFSGSRETSNEGCRWAHSVAEGLAEEYVIVSGGASGVDTAAHRGALAADGETIVVFGTGLNNPYPPENTDLFEKIVDEDGLIVSERPPEAGPDRHGFLQRNKTNSALGQGVVIPAAGSSSGTKSQYRDAVKQGKPVFVPEEAFGFEPRDGIRDMIHSQNEVVQVHHEQDVLSHPTISEGHPKTQSSLGDWE